MVKESSALDELAARAQGEISIREAVQELRVWSEQTDFQLTEYKVRNVDICELFDLESSSCADVLLISLFSEQHQQPVSGSNQRLERDVHSSGRSQQSLLQSLKESPYFVPFQDQCAQVRQYHSTVTSNPMLYFTHFHYHIRAV